MPVILPDQSVLKDAGYAVVQLPTFDEVDLLGWMIRSLTWWATGNPDDEWWRRVQVRLPELQSLYQKLLPVVADGSAGNRPVDQ